LARLKLRRRAITAVGEHIEADWLNTRKVPGAGGNFAKPILSNVRAARSSDVMLMGVMLDTGKEVRS
jgi:hypothetical protein